MSVFCVVRVLPVDFGISVDFDVWTLFLVVVEDVDGVVNPLQVEQHSDGYCWHTDAVLSQFPTLSPYLQPVLILRYRCAKL